MLSQVFQFLCCPGMICLAPYSGDNEYYEAVINSIHMTSGGQTQAVVTFFGYESEGSEVVPVTVLRAIGKQPDRFVIQGDSTPSLQKKRKGKLNVSIQHNRRLLRSGKSRKKSKSNVTREDCEKSNERTEHRASKEKTTLTPAKPSNVSFDASCKKTEEDDYDEMLADGFDDQDMERPSFAQAAQYPSVPLVLSEPGVQPVTQVPATINRYLRDYQRDGVRFLYQHFSQNTGAILGDDMGLGKTVQVISFIAAVLGKTGTKADIFCKFMDGKNKGKQKKELSSNERGTFLIVSPGSVMYNWKEELETWGHFKTGLFHGSTKGDTLQRALRGRLDVALTTYETMRNHLGDLNKVQWLAVVMDELHRLKDRKAQITIAAKALSVKRRYGLTGTPLQNKLEEFWCVLDWANPGSLGKVKRFNLEYGKPIREGQTFDATKRELALGRKKSKDLQERIGKFFLRRTKDLIANQLPNKDELVVFCPLTSFQEDVYQTLLQNPDVELVRKKNFPCDCGSGVDRGKCCYMLSSDGEDIKTVTMRFFQLLLKVANHAALLAPTVRQTMDQREKAQDLCLHVFARYPDFSGCTELSSFELLSDPKYCGKMKVLDKLLRMCLEEHSKILVFSRSTQLLNILEEFVISKGLVYSRLDGGTKPADRTRLVRDFNLDSSISLCLISTKAGGLGLNFTGANVVIIFDPDWNPSSDLQAQDRAYRIGQRRDVRVYRLISSGTIEEMIYLRQVYKQQLANIAIKGTNERRYFTGVEGDKDRKGELFGLENLFSYRADGANLSKDIVKRTEKLEAGYRVAKYEIVYEKKRDDSLENEVTGAKQKEDEDPYGLEEIASQFIDDEEVPPSNPRIIADKSEEHLNKAGTTQMRDKKIDDQEGSRDVDNNAASFNDVEDILAQEIAGLGASSESNDQKLVESSTNFAARKLVSLEDFFGCEDAFIQSGTLTADNDARIKGGKGWSGPCTGDPASVIPPTAREESSSFSREEQNIETRGPKKYFTKIKEKVGKKKAQNTEASYDVIPPTVSFKSKIQDDFYEDDLQSSRKDRNLPESSSSSEEEDSDEGLFTRSKQKRKRKPGKVVVTETSKILKEGRHRLRRFPGKHAPHITVNRKEAEVKRSRKENTVEQILESCGVRYAHANRHIVGPSEAENHMSKQALLDVFELRQFSQQPANCFPTLETSDESDDLGEGSVDTKPEKEAKPGDQAEVMASHANPPSLKRSLKTNSDGTVERIGNSTVFVGTTPRRIRRQHFREMSDLLGFSSEIDFAKAVVESTGAERRGMLKRFYVDRNPDLSALSCFTTKVEMSGVTSDNKRQDFKRAKRSLKEPRDTEDHVMRKKSEKTLKKPRTKVKVHGKDVSSEESCERHENQLLDLDNSHGRKVLCSAVSLQEKKEADLKKRTKKIEVNEASKDMNCNIESVTNLNGRKCTTGSQDLLVIQGNQLQTEDEQCSLSALKSNKRYRVEFQGSSIDNTDSVTSVSILDEFLSISSCRGGRKRENVDKSGKLKRCSIGEKDNLMVMKDKETVKKMKPSSVLDQFI